MAIDDLTRPGAPGRAQKKQDEPLMNLLVTEVLPKSEHSIEYDKRRLSVTVTETTKYDMNYAKHTFSEAHVSGAYKDDMECIKLRVKEKLPYVSAVYFSEAA